MPGGSLGELADALLAADRYEEALEAVMQLPAGDAGGLVRRSLALACLRRFDEAREALARARGEHPRETAAFIASRAGADADVDAVLSPENVFLSRRFAALGRCDWSGWSAQVDCMRGVAASEEAIVEPAASFMAQHLPLSGAERHAVARRVAARAERASPPLPAPGPRTRPRIRVGILSPDYREHLNAYLLLPLFELADRDRFELIAYSLVPDDGSAARAHVRAAADGFRDLHALPDHEAALAIRADDVDVLLDAAGHTAGGRFGIVARRPARIQALYLGFSASLASTRIDYALVDRTVAAPAEQWSERLEYLPHTWFLYDFRAGPATPLARRADYGLPEDAFVCCAFHRAEKISPDGFDLWMRVLREVPASVLWLLELSEPARRSLRVEAARRGVDPSRLFFAPFEPRNAGRYLARQRLGDLMLDALHHTAMTTACDALGGGLPVLTLAGDAMAARGGASLVAAAGLPDFVVDDAERYVTTAVALSRDGARLAAARKTLLARKGPLFDTAGRVREIERCLERMAG